MPNILHFLAPGRESALQRCQIPTIATTDFTFGTIIIGAISQWNCAPRKTRPFAFPRR